MVIPQTGKHPLWWRAVTSFFDNDGGRWSFSLRYQAERTSVWSSWSPLNHCYQRPAVLEKTPEGIMRNIGVGCLKTSQYFPWICVSRSSEKQPLIWGWFSARDDSLVIFQQRETLLRQKIPWKIHKNEIHRAPICPHHTGVEETIHSIWGKSRRKATFCLRELLQLSEPLENKSPVNIMQYLNDWQVYIWVCVINN